MQKNTTAKVQCITCKRVLSLSKFRQYKNRSGSIGYRHDCRECEREKDRERSRQQCIVCEKVLPLSKFRRYKNKSGFGYRRSCKECESKTESLRYHQKKAEKKMECVTCKRVLPPSKFRKYKNRSGSFRYRRSCRQCERKAEAIRHQMQKVQKDEFRFLNFYRKVKGN